MENLRSTAQGLFSNLKQKATSVVDEINSLRKDTQAQENKILELEMKIKLMEVEFDKERISLQEKIDAKMPSGDHAKDIFDIHLWLMAYSRWLASRKLNYSETLNTTDRTIAKELHEAHKELYKLINSIEEIYKIRKSEGPTAAEIVEKQFIESMIANEQKIDEEERNKKSR